METKRVGDASYWGTTGGNCLRWTFCPRGWSQSLNIGSISRCSRSNLLVGSSYVLSASLPCYPR